MHLEGLLPVGFVMFIAVLVIFVVLLGLALATTAAERTSGPRDDRNEVDILEELITKHHPVDRS